MVILQILMADIAFPKITGNPGGQSFSSMWLLMLLPGLFLGLGSFVVTLIEYLKSEVVLTDEHLRFKVGWLSLGSTEIMLSKIETITLFEPLIGRLAGYGTVAVTGTGGTAFHLRFLPDSKHLHSLLQTMVNQAQTGQAPRYSSPTPSPSSNETRLHAQRIAYGLLGKCVTRLCNPVAKNKPISADWC